MFKILVLTFVEKIYKMQHLEGSGTPVLYIGRTVLKGYNWNPQCLYRLVFSLFTFLQQRGEEHFILLCTIE